MFQPLKKIISQRVNQYVFKKEIAAFNLISEWQSFVCQEFGPEISEKTQATSFRDGVLKVNVSHSALLQELRLREQKFITKINKVLKNPPKLERIIYKISRF